MADPLSLGKRALAGTISLSTRRLKRVPAFTVLG
jgi:hypothetical protein